jgi:hypothetical protein
MTRTELITKMIEAKYLCDSGDEFTQTEAILDFVLKNVNEILSKNPGSIAN